MLAVFHLVGCGGEAPAPDPGVTTPPAETFPAETSPDPWTFEDDEPPPGPVEPRALEDALQFALERILDYDAEAIVAPYVARYTQSATAVCPGAVVDPYGNEYWATGCNADDGTYFGGYISQYVFTDVYVDDGEMYQSGAQLSGNIVLVEPDGGTLDLEGTAVIATGASLDGNTRVRQSTLLGGFAYDSVRATSWLEDGMQAVDVTLVGYELVDLGFRLTLVDGALNPFIAGETWSVQFASSVADEPSGSVCALEPGGTIQIRDPAGRWATLLFTGPVFDPYTGDLSSGDMPECDGCAEATVDGEPIGTVCADFTPWLDWELTP